MISTDLNYPEQLPWPSRSGYTFQDVATFDRSEMQDGRSAQRQTFEFVPSMVNVQWDFDSDDQASLFRAWFRDAIHNGAAWFNCPLKTPLGEKHYICRFASMPKGPDLVGLCSWRATATLEMFERPIIAGGWGNYPEWLDAISPFDIAMNHVWPKFKTRDFNAENTVFGKGNGSQSLFTLRDDRLMPMYSVSSVTAMKVDDAMGLWWLTDGPRTNLTPYSNSDFSKTTKASLEVGYGVSPTGTSTNYMHSSPSYSGYVRTTGSISYALGVDYVISVFCRPVGGDNGPLLALYGPDAVFGTNKQIRVRRNGTATGFNSPKGFGVELLADGWFRVWVCVTATASASSAQVRIILGGANDATNGWEFFGFQVEQGSEPTPYIATDGTAKTIIDYARSGVNVTFAAPHPARSTLLWTGSGEVAA